MYTFMYYISNTRTIPLKIDKKLITVFIKKTCEKKQFLAEI